MHPFRQHHLFDIGKRTQKICQLYHQRTTLQHLASYPSSIISVAHLHQRRHQHDYRATIMISPTSCRRSADIPCSSPSIDMLAELFTTFLCGQHVCEHRPRRTSLNPSTFIDHHLASRCQAQLPFVIHTLQHSGRWTFLDFVVSITHSMYYLPAP